VHRFVATAVLFLGCEERGFPKDPRATIQMKWCRIVDRESSCTF